MSIFINIVLLILTYQISYFVLCDVSDFKAFTNYFQAIFKYFNRKKSYYTNLRKSHSKIPHEFRPFSRDSQKIIPVNNIQKYETDSTFPEANAIIAITNFFDVSCN